MSIERPQNDDRPSADTAPPMLASEYHHTEDAPPTRSGHEGDDDLERYDAEPSEIGRVAVATAVEEPVRYTRTVRPRRSRNRPGDMPSGADRPAGRPERRRQPAPRLEHVDRLEETEPNEGNGSKQTRSSNTKPDPQAVAQAARAGRPMARFFTWFHGAASVDATPESIPQTAEKRENTGPEPQGEAPTPPDSTNEQSQPVATGMQPPVPMKWARLKAIFEGPAEQDGAKAQEPEKGTKLDEVVKSHRDKNFTIGIVAHGVTQDEHGRLIRDAQQEQIDASRTELNPNAKLTAAKHAADLNEYANARQQSALVEETVGVGVDVNDVAELEEIAEHAARSVLSGSPSSRHIRYEVERNPDGTVRQYDSMDDVVVAADADPDRAVVSAEEYAGHCELPDRPLPGLGRRMAPTNFDVERTIPEGKPRVKIGEILDNHGNPTGQPLEMTKEHTEILAETEAGKSVLLRAIGTDHQRQNVARKLEAEAAGRTDYDHEALVYLDCKKQDVFSDKFSRQVRGAIARDVPGASDAIADAAATVHHIVPGGSGPGVRWNLLKPVGKLAADWRKRIDTAIEVLASKYKDMDPDTLRTMKKFFGSTIDHAMAMMGRDPRTGSSKYPHGSPATPTGEFASGLTAEVVRSADMSEKHSSDVIGWVGSEMATVTRGDNGAPLAAEGYDFNGRAALDNEGITSVDLANMRDKGARQVTALGVLFDLYDACVEKNREEGIVGETDKHRLTVVIDEADIFGNDALGASLADFFTHARSVGMRIIFAKQGDERNSIHPQVSINTPNKIILRTGHRPDLESFAEAAGMTTLDDMKHLAAAAQGDFVYKGPGMPRGVRGRVANPHDPEQTPMADAGIVVGPENLVDLGADPEFFDRELKIEARAMLAKDRLGADISTWTEDSTLAILLGKGLNELTGSPLAELQAGLNDPTERQKIRCAISMAVQNAVDSRPDLQWKADRLEYSRHIITHSLALAEGVHLPGWNEPRPDLALDVGHFNPKYNPDAPVGDENRWKKFIVEIDGRFGNVKDYLENRMTAMPHPDTAEFSAQLKMNFVGETIREQIDEAHQGMISSVNSLGDLAKNIAAKGYTPGIANQAKRHISLLVCDALHEQFQLEDGDLNEVPTETQQAIREKAFEYINEHVLRQNKYNLNGEQAGAIIAVINDTALSDLMKPVGYATVLEELQAHADEYQKTAPAVSQEKILELCGKEAPGNTAKEQYDFIEQQLEQEHMATVSYASKVQANQLFFAPDMVRSGPVTTLDGNMAVIMGGTRIDGPIFRSRRVGAGQASEVDLTVGPQMAAGMYKRWKNNISNNFLYTPNIIRSPAQTRKLVQMFGKITKQLWQDHEEDKLRIKTPQDDNKVSAK